MFSSLESRENAVRLTFPPLHGQLPFDDRGKPCDFWTTWLSQVFMLLNVYVLFQSMQISTAVEYFEEA